jgi:glutathione S-transferase
MNPRRARIFMAEKGIEVPMVEVDMMKGENRQPAYLAINSLGTMPSLELDDGTIITESIAICRYFEEIHPDPPMFGRDTVERAKVEMWNRRMELELLNSIGGAFMHLDPFWDGKVPQVAEFGEISRVKGQKRMAWLDGHLEGREFIATDDYTVADITAQCAVLLGQHTGTPIPDGLDNLTRWWKAVSSRPSARA